MTRRVLAAWLPRLSTERIRDLEGLQAHQNCSKRASQSVASPPLAVIANQRGRLVLTAVDARAAAAGLTPGLSLADARALEPGVRVVEADPAGDSDALARLARWAERYTPWAVPCGDAAAGEGGLLLDVTGCAHLVGGEAALLDDLARRLSRLGFRARAAIADTAGAAWAVARVGAAHAPGHGAAPERAVVAAGAIAATLAPLPIRGLRLEPAVANGLERLGLGRIGDLERLPRGTLSARFGSGLLRRLDQALGRIEEPLSPPRPVPTHAARLTFAEPIARTEDVSAALDRLLVELCAGLAETGQGARRLDLQLFRVDGAVERQSVGTSRPCRTAEPLKRLLRDRLDRIDAGFGIETMRLAAARVEPLADEPLSLDRELGAGRADGADEALAGLVDRLVNRLGPAAVARPLPRESHLPERAVALVPAVPPAPLTRAWPADRPRPVRLLARPIEIEAVAPLPDDPPVLFLWRGVRHHVARADGPERLAAEWWVDAAGTPPRDYYRVEDTEGRRFWLCRAGPYRADRQPAWFLHGFFA